MTSKAGIGPRLKLERQYWQKGLLVAGADETGRGALAGPLVAAAVILEPGMRFTGFWRSVDDSKRLSKGHRQQLALDLKNHTRNFAYGMVSAQEIDSLGIDRANKEALERAVRALPEAVNVVLTDWIRIWPLDLECLKPPGEQLRFVRGEALHLSIAAASVLAKVYKDRYMVALDQRFPAFGFGSNSGYLTRQHAAAIKEHGPCPEHRFSFKPLSDRFTRTSA